MGIDVCNYCKGLTNCSVENGTKTSAVKICVFVSGHLGFLPFQRLDGCQGEARYQIWWEPNERFESYWGFCEIQNGGQRPSWITNFRVLTPRASFWWRVDARNQIWCESDEPFWSYAVFKPISGFVGRHLGFCKMSLLNILVFRRCHNEAPRQIWWESDKRFKSY